MDHTGIGIMMKLKTKKMSKFIKALLANPFRFKFSINEEGNLFLDVGIVWIIIGICIPLIL